MNAMEDDTKIPLLKFIKLLTDNGVPVPAAMSVAGKMYVKISVLVYMSFYHPN
jgi:hypothetical protein